MMTKCINVAFLTEVSELYISIALQLIRVPTSAVENMSLFRDPPYNEETNALMELSGVCL